ncbi:MAG: PAS domain-containing protein, partial [Hyphomonadaceae bacterium]|nr:PAS domain-containing protein [Hyphomonadaceae bacterium]
MTRPQNPQDDPLASALADVSLQAMAVLRGGKLLFVNRGFCDLFGYDAPAEALADAAMAGAIAAVAGPAAHGGVVFGRRLVRRRDGRGVPVELYARLAPWGDAPALVVALIDVGVEEAALEGAAGDDRYAARPVARRGRPDALRIALAGADARCAGLRDALAAGGAIARIVALQARPEGPAPDVVVLTPAPG